MADDKKKKGFKGVLTEMAEERRGEPARKAKGKFMIKRLTKSEADAAAEPKAEKLKRLMKKGYRKGYRVPKRPEGKGPELKPRSPFSRKKSRSSGRKSSGR